MADKFVVPEIVTWIPHCLLYAVVVMVIVRVVFDLGDHTK